MGQSHEIFTLIFRNVADPDPFNTDPDPAFQFDTDLDPTVWYGSGSLPFQRGNLLKQYHTFIHLYLISLSAGPTGPTQKVFFVKFSLPVNFVVPLE